MLRRATIAAVRSRRMLPITTSCLQIRSETTSQSPTYGAAYEPNTNVSDLPDAPIPLAVKAVYHAPLRHPAEYNIPVCDLQIRSFSIKNVEFFADFALRAAYYLKLPAFGPVPLPRRTERWTIPKSNFVHKKAQQNFERVTYSRLIQIKDGHPDVVQVWLAFLRKHEYYGTGMKANVWTFEKLGSGRKLAKKVEEARELADNDAAVGQQLKVLQEGFRKAHKMQDNEKKLKAKKAKKEGEKEKEARRRAEIKLSKKVGYLEHQFRVTLTRIRDINTEMKQNYGKGWDALVQRERQKQLESTRAVDREIGQLTKGIVDISTELNSMYGKYWRYSKLGRVRVTEEEATAQTPTPTSAETQQEPTASEEVVKGEREVEVPIELEKAKKGQDLSELPTSEPPAATTDTPVSAENSISNASSGHPEDHILRELEEGQEEVKDFTTSPSEASAGHPEDHLPREMEEAKEEEKPVNAGPLFGNEIKVEEKIEETSGEPVIEMAIETEPADQGEKEEIVHATIPLTPESAHPEPTASEDAVAADKADVDLSHPEPLDFRQAKDIEMTLPPKESEPTPVDTKISVPEEDAVTESIDHTPQPTESEADVAADSDLVPPPTQQSTKEDFRNAKEIQIDEAMKKDSS
ncbi:hypothetical protein ABW19_dt0205320 [Dactylella cylindrospora]|nr:hypothetical protein ABW19_dt0205320 [Dactylella cylindrospora]